MKITSKRAVRRDPGRSRLMPRELEALAFIAAAQPVATAAYQEFLGVSVAVARRSLRKLRNLGFINVFVIALEAPSHFAITKRGAVHLAETQDRPVEDFRILRGISKLPLRHHDGGAYLAAALHRASRLHGGITLADLQFESAIRRTLKLAASTQIPDAVVILRQGNEVGHRLAWAIEIDMASESPAYVAKRKGQPYAELKANGAPLLTIPDWRVMCIVPTRQRLQRLVSALWEAGIPEGEWYFAIASEVSAATVFSSAWQTVRTTQSGEEANLIREVPLPAKAVLTTCHNGPTGQVR